MSVSALPNGYKTLKTYWSDSLGCLDVIIIILLNSRVNNEFIFYFDTDRYFTPLPPNPSMFMMGVAWGSGPAHLKSWRSNCTFWPYLKWYFGTAETILKTRKSVQSDTIWKLCENNVSKACVLTVFKTIWNCREHFENNVFKACALKVFEAILNFRKIIENNVSKVCIIALFETIWNCRENMKTWKHGRLRVQYDTLWYDILTCRDNFESNEVKWCLLTGIR